MTQEERTALEKLLKIKSNANKVIIADNKLYVLYNDVEDLFAAQFRSETNEITDDMTKFILEIDSLTTTEFCEKYDVPLPVFTGEVKSSADQFLRIDAIKHRMFVEHAKELARRSNRKNER